MNEYRNHLLKKSDIMKCESDLNIWDWIYISRKTKLTDEFISEFKKSLNWTSISIYQKLSEDFIRKYQHRLEWREISRTQKLSNVFLIEFEDMIDWFSYFQIKEPSYLILKRYILKIDAVTATNISLEHLNSYEQEEIQRLINLKQLFKV